MRGRYTLTDWEKEYWPREIQKIIYDQMTYELDAHDLTNADIAPYQLSDVVEILGWKCIDREYSGWEQECWQYYEHEDFPGWRINIFSCGMTFELTMEVYKI